MLQSGELEVVVPSVDHAARILDEARRHSRSAETIAEENPSGALNLAYDAARQAANSLLAAQGLRPTTSGGHIAVQDASIQQFNGPFKDLKHLRRRRHSNQYPSATDPQATLDDAREAIAMARSMVSAAEQLIDKVTSWR
jgi:uncharacterized protein (UPF0332 family)